LHKGQKAPQAAGVIHTIFERGFIKAEICRCEDLLSFGSEAALRDKGLLRIEGKEYVVQMATSRTFASTFRSGARAAASVRPPMPPAPRGLAGGPGCGL